MKDWKKFKEKIIMNEWHKKFFNELYLNLFMKRTQYMFYKEVNLITSLFPMEEI